MEQKGPEPKEQEEGQQDQRDGEEGLPKVVKEASKKDLRKPTYSMLHLANEIPDANIKLLKQLGAGSFGVVYAGECFGSPG